MTITLFLLITFFPRPECPPLTTADIQKMFLLEQTCATTIPSQPVFPENAEPIPNRFVIGFQSATLSAILNHIQTLNGQVINIDSGGQFLVARFPEHNNRSSLQLNITSLPGVRFVEPDFSARVLHIPNDSMFLKKQWDKWVMYADKAWDITTGGNVKVAVVDNGVQYFHTDLAANFRSGELGYDFIGNDADPRPDDPGVAEAFHGTHVSGIIAGVSNNLIGIAGWAQIQLLAVRVLDDSGNGTLTDVAKGIRWAADHDAKVINMSLGGDAASTPLIEACHYALQKGALLIAASGNDGRSGITYPARMSECVAVGATDELSGLAYFSNYGPEQEVVAPGTAIYSTATGNGYVEASGTSMACPQVSGVAALVFALNPSLTANQVRAIIGASAIDMGSTGRDEYFGFGLVNAYRALQLAQTLQRGTIKTAEPHKPAITTIITHHAVSLPELKGTVSVYNPAGRVISKIPINNGVIVLPEAGTYFLQLQNQDGSSQLLKVLVLN